MKKPNILLVMPDQMRGDCLSLENHPALATPAIDSIGREGVAFARAYTTCPSCIAARRSLLTGQFPPTHGMVGYRERVPLQAPTVTQLLHDAGYETVLAGRYMHQSPRETPYGFEKRVLGSTYIRDDDYARHLQEQAPDLGGINGIGLSCNSREVKAWPVEESLHPTNWVIEQAQRLLAGSDGERPLFLAASFYAPHSPLFPPGRYMEQILKKDLPPAAIGEWDTPPAAELYKTNPDSNRVVLEGTELRTTQAGYFGLIQHLDDLLPGLLADFKAKSEAQGRPWVIVFTSDHGEMLGDHYLFRKCEPYEGSSRIPFLIQGSKELGFVAGSRCDSPVGLEDIMPTLLTLADVSIPETVEGESLVPVLKGEADCVRTVIHGEHATCYDKEQGFHMLTDGKTKYIWRPASGEEQLFDLQTDPQEKHNLATKEEMIIPWRNRLIERLADRPEGFTDGDKLIAGQTYEPVLPHAQKEN